MRKRIDFRTSQYFYGGFIVAGVIILVFGILLLFVNIWVGISLLITGIVITSTHYRLRIDFDNKLYRDYVWFLGMSIGPSNRFDQIEYFYIKSGRQSRTMQLRVARTTAHTVVFDGFLKFSEANKVHVVTKESRQSLINKLTPMATALNVRIVDYTQSQD
jgi:hypothetical protein